MMRTTLRLLAVSALLWLWSTPGQAQTVDEIIEKHLAATGGRAALAALTSRVSTGTISLTTPIGELMGSIEVYGKKPNKSRTLITVDLSAVGGGQAVSDQRFDGVHGFVIDTVNGNREITGGQLDLMRNGVFPTPLLNYREAGSSVALVDNEKVGGKDAYVIRLTPKAGPATKLFIDADSLMLVRTAITLSVPELGGDIEQVVEFSDFRDVDGIKVPFMTVSANRLQTIKAVATEIRHNVEIEDSSFSRPQ